MKILVALCVVIAVANADWAPKTPDDLHIIRDECFISEKVSEANIAKIENSEFPNEPDVRCYVRCVASRNGVFDDVNGFDINRAKQQLETLGNTASLENLAKCCTANTNNVDSCTFAYESFKCQIDNQYITKLIKVFNDLPHIE